MRNHNIIPYTKEAREWSRQLRNSMTRSEKIFWYMVKGSKLGVVVRRQLPMLDYVVDFYIKDKEIGLAIEIDGSSHDNNFLEDAKRQQRIEDLGVKFIRFTNEQVQHQPDKVIEEIQSLIIEMKDKTK
ncbi:endonuclease domain-containing protein [Nonlabens sp.]|uniref:endonuclease domain-containing protein n=1 Tax=Nonlabens sp. TaxID=1888209 RepID=UPI003F6A4516